MDRIVNPILLPIRSGGSYCITRAHEPRHHGIYDHQQLTGRANTVVAPMILDADVPADDDGRANAVR